MAALAELHQAVAATLTSKRLGTPVFVRYTLQGADEPKAALTRLAQTMAVVRDWIGQKLDRLHASASKDGGQVALTLQFAEGATALVCFARGKARAGVDLLVLGNRGSLAHDAGQAELSDEPLDVTLPAADAALVALIEKALKSGKPESAAGVRP